MLTYILIGVALIAASATWQVTPMPELFESSTPYATYRSPRTCYSIPGPLPARITGQWLTFIDLAGYRTTWIHKLHQQYGPTVRIGPNEISFSNSEMIKEIYGQQTAYMKAPIYGSFSDEPVGIFSMRDKAAHSQRRRLLSHTFSQANLNNTEPIIKQTIEKLVARMDRSLGRPVDMLLTFRLLSFDIIGELFLGMSFGGLDMAGPPQFLIDMDRSFLLGGISWSLPPIAWILHCLPVASVQHFLKSRDRLIGYGREAFNKYVALYGRDSGRKDLLTKIVSTKSADDAPLTDRQIHAEIANLVLAGTDTTSTTLTYLFWDLARHPQWLARVQEELSASQFANVPAHKDVMNLPVLDSIIMEALRLHPAAPASLQRETPTGGRLLNGFFIPEKTIVSMQCYTTQRSPTIFPDPDNFNPERWTHPTEEMKLMFMPFSVGPRACLGKTLAMMELKMICATLLRRYNVRLAPGTTEESMRMTDHFLVIPRGGRCELVFAEAEGV